MVNSISTNGVQGSGKVTTTTAQSAEGGRFVNTRAFRDAVAGLNDRGAPVYRPSSGQAGQVAQTNRASLTA